MVLQLQQAVLSGHTDILIYFSQEKPLYSNTCPDNILELHALHMSYVRLYPHYVNSNVHLQGEVGLGEKGFRELVKGMAKSSGALKVRSLILSSF